eukprot:gene7293-11612_t
MEKKKRKVHLPLSILCDDEIFTIFSFMDTKELFDLSETSKEFHSVVEDFAKTVNKEVILDPWTIQKALKNKKDVDQNKEWRITIDLFSVITLKLSKDILMYLPNLEELSVFVPYRIDPRSLNVFSNIETLHIIHNPNGGYFDYEFPPNLEKLKNLKSLKIESDNAATPVENNFGDGDLRDLIHNISYLEELTIKHCSQLDENIFSLIKHTSLKKLHLENHFSISNCCEEMEQYGFKNDLNNLVEIHLYGFKNVSKKEFLVSLNEHCKNLKKIDLEVSYRDNFNDEVFFELFQKNYFPNLEILILGGLNLEKYQKLRPTLQIKL